MCNLCRSVVRTLCSLQVNDWENCESFNEMKEFVKHLKVTNECAERGIKLVSDYAQSLTKSDEEREDMLQVVQAHRQFHPGQSKSSFLSIDTNLFSI